MTTYYRVILLKHTTNEGIDCGVFSENDLDKVIGIDNNGLIEAKTGKKIIDLLTDQKIAKLEDELEKLKATKAGVTRG